MKTFISTALTIISIVNFTIGQPISLHKDNPHYLSYKGAPILLITSAEHYGAILNLDFDYTTYLNTLHADGMNYTRIFTGSYVENTESFGIENNTLAPLENKVITPWGRSQVPGYINGGNKFDLLKWNDEYFSRLKDFLQIAFERDIIVEITMFSSIYNEDNWHYSPLYSGNNINQTDFIERKFVSTLSNGNLFEIQKGMVAKIVREVNAFDNVIFEIQNEPWSDQTDVGDPLNFNNQNGWDKWFGKTDPATKLSLEWQKEIARIIVETEKSLSKKHLIAQNYANFRYPIPEVDPNISIINFHYAWPEAVYLNYAYNRVINFDESGFSGNEDETYRVQAWRFMLAGGGIFNNLDYSFVAGHETGDFNANSPGRGSVTLRKQLRILREFLETFDYVNMEPDPSLGLRVVGAHSSALVNKGQAYAIYFYIGDACKVKLDLSQGKYEIKWINPASGKVISQRTINHKGGEMELSSPAFDPDIALSVKLK